VRLVIRPAWLLLAIGCGGGSGTVKDEGDTTGDADTDSDADSDADADADADSDADTDVFGDTNDTAPPGRTTEPSTTTGGGCVVEIPGTAIVVDAASVFSVDSTEGWICRNSTASMSGAFGTFWVESNGSLVVSGNNNLIYVRSGADLAVYSDDNVFFLEPGVDLLDEGLNNQTVSCDPMTFDLFNAPADGC
jgi:hypothetical protein